MEPIIGLDFGDNYSFACFVQGFDSENRTIGVIHDLLPLRFTDGIPSVYFYSKRVGKVLLGDRAVTGSAIPIQNRLKNLRRYLGQTIQIDDRAISYDSAITEVVQYCIRIANECLEKGWHVSTNLVSLSYPATYSLAQRQRLIDLVEKATLEDGRQIKVYGTIATPAAAALDYLVGIAAKYEEETVLVYDLCGDSFELGLVSIYPKGRKGRDGNIYYYDIINTSGIPQLGSDAFDEVMFRLISSKIDISLDPQMKARLIHFSEMARVELMDMMDAQFSTITSNGPLDISVTRTDFEKVAMPLVQKTIDETRQMLNMHTNRKPDCILLTGEASQMPIIMREMENAFPDYKGKIKIYKPSTSVAHGAARYGRLEMCQMVKESRPSLRLVIDNGKIFQIDFQGFIPYESDDIFIDKRVFYIQQYTEESTKWVDIMKCIIDKPAKVRVTISNRGELNVKVNDNKDKEIEEFSMLLNNLS